MLIEGGSVMVAMYCLVQFYMQLKDDLVEHKPFLKITAVKLVIFLSFWQTVRNPIRTFGIRSLTPFLATPIDPHLYRFG